MAEQVRTDVDMPELRSKTCFSCVHYTDSWCELFEAEVDSEVYAARNCTEFNTPARSVAAVTPKDGD